MTAYLIYDDCQSALDRADAEGMAQGLPYWTVGTSEITRRPSDPRETADNTWALPVDGYDLTPEEQSQIVTEVTWPEDQP